MEAAEGEEVVHRRSIISEEVLQEDASRARCMSVQQGAAAGSVVSAEYGSKAPPISALIAP